MRPTPHPTRLNPPPPTNSALWDRIKYLETSAEFKDHICDSWSAEKLRRLREQGLFGPDNWWNLALGLSGDGFLASTDALLPDNPSSYCFRNPEDLRCDGRRSSEIVFIFY